MDAYQCNGFHEITKTNSVQAAFTASFPFMEWSFNMNITEFTSWPLASMEKVYCCANFPPLGLIKRYIAAYILASYSDFFSLNTSSSSEFRLSSAWDSPYLGGFGGCGDAYCPLQLHSLALGGVKAEALHDGGEEEEELHVNHLFTWTGPLTCKHKASPWAHSHLFEFVCH